MTDTRNGALPEMIATTDLDSRAKGILEMLEKDENVPPELLERLLGGGSDLIRRLFSDENIDEEKIKRADAFFEGIKAFVDGNEWHASVVDKENRVIVMGFSMRNTSLKVLVRVDAEVESVTINTTLPISCLTEYRLLMDSKLGRLNETLRYGAFRLDEDDGEITYRLTYSMAGQEFNSKMFDNYLDCCLITPDINYKKIVKYATGALSKDEKIEVLGKLKSLAVAINE